MNIELWPLVQGVPAEAGDTEFAECWAKVGGMLGERSNSGKVAMLEVMRDTGALQSGAIHPAWGGGWRWDMSSGAAKSVLASGLIYGMMVAAGVTGLLPLVAPAVIPLLFEVKKVRLTREESNVIKIIGARPGVFQRGGTRSQLYATLPQEVRESLTESEFEGFVDSAIAAGVARENGEVVEILSTGETVFRLELK